MNECVWSNGGMILTGENRCPTRKTFPSATLSPARIWLLFDVFVCTTFICTCCIMIIDLLGVHSWVTNHDVSVDSDGEDGEQRYGHKTVSCQREQLAQQVAMAPGALPKCRRR